MSQIEVADREGWRRVYTITKAIAFIGSHPQSDIVLDAARGGGVAARHLQLLATAGGFRMVNLGETEVVLNDGRRVSPRASLDLNDGEHLRVGEFTLIFYADGAPAGDFAAAGGPSGARPLAGSSRVIGISARWANTTLDPDQPIEATITVRNLGDKTGAQFRLEVEGLPPEACDIGPGPILFPNAQKDVIVQLKHPRLPKPAVGSQRVTIRASAPIAYPGESAAVTQAIQILPYYQHQVRITPVEPNS
jgi:hypothetical protein